MLSQAKLSLVVRAIPVFEIVKSMVATQILLAAIVIFVAMDTIRDNKDNLYIFSWFILNCTYIKVISIAMSKLHLKICLRLK